MSLTAYGLRCEYRVTPLGMDEPRPRLSWRLRADEPGQRQTGYRITIGEAWDSGWVASDAGVAEYAGTPLAPETSYVWRLELTDAGGQATPAAISWFETGIGAWQADWIRADPDRAPPAQPPGRTDRSRLTRRLAPPVQFRREFWLGERPSRARCYASARGIYRLQVNGVRVGDHELAPGWTEYHRRIQYQTYDITGLLQAGANVVGITVADGWWCGYVGADPRHHAQHYGTRPEAIAQIVVDGQRIGTSAAWRCAPGAVRYADLQMGEYQDARLATDGWDRPGYDDSGWDPAAVASGRPAVLVAQPDEPVRVVAELSAVPADGTVVDFGQNIAGRVRLTIRGAPPGRRIQVRHGEVLDGNALYTENLRSAEATDTYITRGRPVEVFEPAFTVHGFRYAEITGYPVAATDITAEVLHSDTPWVGGFACSDPLINQIASNIAWSQRGNFVAVPTDCPQRDERQGWLADAQVFAPTACRHADVAAFFARWLRDVRDGQRPSGAYGDIAPMIGVRPESAPGWGDAGVLIPWQLWREYGDRRTLELSYPGMQAWIEHIRAANPALIWRSRTGNNYGDWLHVGEDTPRDLVATACFARSARTVADAARVLGHDARRHDDLAAAIARAFAAEFVAAEGNVGNGTETGYLLALGFGLVPADRVSAVFGRLAARVEERGLETGFLGLPLLCPVLAAHGRADLAYAVLQGRDYPSWGHEIRHGATTIWERWDGWTAEHGFAPAEMNSFNHYALGAVGDWLFGGIAGIGQTSAGYRDIEIAPVIGGGLTWARARHDSVRGLISSRWQLDGDHLRLEAELPPGPDGVLVVPAGTLSGADRARRVEQAGDTLRIAAGPGRHTIDVDLAGPCGPQEKEERHVIRG